MSRQLQFWCAAGTLLLVGLGMLFKAAWVRDTLALQNRAYARKYGRAPLFGEPGVLAIRLVGLLVTLGTLTMMWAFTEYR